MKFKLMKNEHGAVITHVALALSGIEREDAAQLIVSPQMALILKDKMSVKEIMTAISSMVMKKCSRLSGSIRPRRYSHPLTSALLVSSDRIRKCATVRLSVAQLLSALTALSATA